MRVLLLSPYPERLTPTLEDAGDHVVPYDLPLTNPTAIYEYIDFVVSYGYRYILKPIPPVPAINLHISLLPWNRGADPNLWSWLEDTPKGVSIHYIDEGIDTGPVLWGAASNLDETGTLATTYAKLQQDVEWLFGVCWTGLKDGFKLGSEQPPGGSYHHSRDKEPYLPLLHSGWDTPVKDLIGKALERPLPPPHKSSSPPDQPLPAGDDEYELSSIAGERPL